MLEEFAEPVVCCFGKLPSFGDDERLMEIAGVPTDAVFFRAGRFICTKEICARYRYAWVAKPSGYIDAGALKIAVNPDDFGR